MSETVAATFYDPRNRVGTGFSAIIQVSQDGRPLPEVESPNGVRGLYVYAGMAGGTPCYSRVS